MKREQLLPYVAAFLAFSLITLAGLLVGGLDSARRDIADHENSARLGEEVLTQANGLLHTLNKHHRASCDEQNLRVLRQLEYRNEHVNDIGVIDNAGRLACTATLGLLQPPLEALVPEFSIVSNGQTIYITDHGVDHVGSEGRPISRGRLNQFQVTVSPQTMERMRSTEFTAVGFIGEDKHLHLIRGTLKSKGNGDEIQTFTHQDIDWFQNGRGFNWRYLALEMRYNVGGLPFVYFQRAPLLSAEATSLEYKFVLLVVAFAVAMLVQALAHETAAKRAEMTYRIKGLLNAENLRCVYQPIVALQSGHIVGCEVLVRLQDGDVLRPPDQFLPAVVDRGLTWKLDQLVIERSVQDLCEQLPPGEPFEIALNLFPQNIKAEPLHALIHGKLGWIPASEFTINLEVIEHEYHDDMLIEIAELKRLGYRVCVDDFGTGFSNLGSMRKFKPDYLKIDRSFVFEMETASVRSSLIPEIVAIARATGAAVIAEGVENEQQLQGLRSLGVEFAQGYFLGRPMTLANLLKRLKEQLRKVVDLAERRQQMPL